MVLRGVQIIGGDIPMVLKRKSKNVDASLNFRNDSGGRLSPLNGSKSFKGKSLWIPTSSSPRQFSSRF